MKNKSNFSRFRLPSIRNGALICAAVLLMTFFAVACVERPSPDQVTAACFETMANGDTFGIRPYLTPDGQEILDQMAATPQIRAAIESQRESRKLFWNGIVRTVSQPSVEGSRAVVMFSAEVPGRGRSTCQIVLFLIDGDWRISSTSVTGPQIDRFLSELIALKAPPAAPAEAKPAAAVKSASVAPAEAKPAAAVKSAPAAAPGAGAEKK